MCNLLKKGVRKFDSVNYINEDLSPKQTVNLVME